MAGGLLQIASSNISDIFLTFKPQITFFKLIYFKYYNFSIETMVILILAKLSHVI